MTSRSGGGGRTVTRHILGVVGERLDFTHDKIRREYADSASPTECSTRRGRAWSSWARRRDPHAVALAALAEAGGGISHSSTLRGPARDGRRAAHREAIAAFDAALAISDPALPRRARRSAHIDAASTCAGAVPLFDGRILDGGRGREAARHRRAARFGWALAYQTHARYVAGDARAARAAGEQALEIATALDDRGFARDQRLPGQTLLCSRVPAAGRDAAEGERRFARGATERGAPPRAARYSPRGWSSRSPARGTTRPGPGATRSDREARERTTICCKRAGEDLAMRRGPISARWQLSSGASTSAAPRVSVYASGSGSAWAKRT